jgi:hypothetical protein
MDAIAKNAFKILEILASSDLPTDNGVIRQRALALGIDTEDLLPALTYAGEQGWIEKAPLNSTGLTASGREVAKTLGPDTYERINLGR